MKHFVVFLITISVSDVFCFLLNDKGKGNPAVMNLYSQTFSGDGTYYGKTPSGTCSYGSNTPSNNWNTKVDALVALNAPQFMNSLTCGTCFKVVGDGKGLGSDPITGQKLVFTKDKCPECQPGDLDFSLSGDGRWNIKMQAVQCPVGNTKIQYAFQGSNPWYIKVQVRNARIPITSIELQVSGKWVRPTHTSDNFWVASGFGKWDGNAINIRMLAANGELLNDSIPRLEQNNDVILDGLRHVQVSYDGSLPSA